MTTRPVRAVRRAPAPTRRGAACEQYPMWFLLPAAVVYVVLFLGPDVRVVLLQPHPLDAVRHRVHRPGELRPVLLGAELVTGLHEHAHLRLVTSGAKVVLGLALAVLLTSQIFGRGYLRTVVFFPVLVSTIGVGITFKVLHGPVRRARQRGARRVRHRRARAGSPTRTSRCSRSPLVDVWKGVGLATLIYIAGIVAIPQEYYEAARVDGAGALAAFRHITLPLVRPATVDRHHPVAHRRAAVVRPDLDDDPRRARLHHRRARLGRSTSSTRPASTACPRRATSCSSSSSRRSCCRSAVLLQPEGGRTVRTSSGVPGCRHRWRIVASIVVFLVPVRVHLPARRPRTRADAVPLEFTWPTEWHLWDNIAEVWQRATTCWCTALRQQHDPHRRERRRSWWCSPRWSATCCSGGSGRLDPVANFLVLAGLIIPPAVVPTIWVLQALGMFKTMPGLILIEVAFGLSFSILLFRAFVATIPRELDEAAIIDGAGPLRLFFRVDLPAAAAGDRHGRSWCSRSPSSTTSRTRCTSCPATTTPPSSSRSSTSRASSSRQCNLLFTDILLITIPPLIMYIFFNRQIVAGMTSGAVKG